jgi:RNA polymerase sigma factor (sigma-70 family)
MPELEENKYWRLFIGGDIDALSVLFRSYAPGLMAYGLKIYPDEELVKDSIQEIFIQLIQKRKTINLDNNVKGFVFRLLRNQLIDEIKFINNRKRDERMEEYLADSFEFDSEHVFIGMEEKTG